MKTASKIHENENIGVAVLDKADQLDVLNQPEISAAIWNRQLPEDFQSWIDDLDIAKLPSARTIVRVEVIRDVLEVICDSAGIPYNLKRRFLIDDVEMLAKEFSNLMQANLLGLRFDVIHDNACKKFHVDAVTARLVCTYRGVGTQYGISSNGEDPEEIYSVPTGAPILLRGSKWPADVTPSLLHRSPPIEGTGMTRLILVIDPVFDEAVHH